MQKIKGLNDFAVAGESMVPIPLGLAFAVSTLAFITVTNLDSLHMYGYAAIFRVLFIEFAFAGQPQLLNKIMALKNPKDMSKMI